MTLPWDDRLNAGRAQNGEHVSVMAPEDHDIGGELEFTYWKDGSVTVRFHFEHDARIEDMEVHDRLFEVQIGPRFS